MTPELKVSRAVTKLAFSHPFFGSLLMTCGHKRDDKMPTMYTEGTYVGWNGDFVDTLTEDNTRAILAHEVMHIVLLHCLPHEGKDRRMCNIAMDYVINYQLADDGFEFPEGVLLDYQFRGMNWLEVYRILMDIYEKHKQAKGCPIPDVDNPNDDGSFPVKMDGTGNGKPFEEQEGDGTNSANNAEIPMDKQEELGESISNAMQSGDFDDCLENSNLSEEEKSDIRRKTLQAAQAAKSAGIGKLPGDIEELINEIRTSKVDWKEYLMETMLANYPEDYTFKRPNKKFLGSYDMYLPTMEGYQVGTIAVHVDTSGSVHSDELAEFLSELNHISQYFNPERVVIYYTDSDVAHKQVFEQGEEIDELEVTGRGGTSFVPTFKAVEEDYNDEIDQMLVFSDMEVWEGCFPDEAPDYPVLFVSTRASYDVPFGDIVTTRGY